MCPRACRLSFQLRTTFWGPCMPAQEWSDFLRAHYRPHLLVVDLGTPSDSTSGRRLVARLGQLTDSLRTSADHAMCCEEREVKIAFESDLDASAFTELLMGRVVERGGEEWASRSACDLGTKLKIVRRPKRHRLGQRRQRPKPNGLT
jgi:hypothetical protein